MFNVILFQPEIPQNTGNIMRLCANTGCHLHLIRPLGFEIDDKHLKRSKLDYVLPEKFNVYDGFEEIEKLFSHKRIFLFSTKGKRCYSEVAFQANDCFVFGPETRGLPLALRERFPEEQCLYLPMQPQNRSLNLSNTVAIAVYEAWRQNAFLLP